MNLVINLVMGATLAGLSEAMALAERAGLQQKDVLEVLDLSSMASNLIIEKGKGERVGKRNNIDSCLRFPPSHTASLIYAFAP